MINKEIADKYNEKIRFTDIIKADLDEFEAVVDGHFLNDGDMSFINEVSKSIYGEGFKLYIYCYSDFNIAFGVYKNG